ncbi:hypothetical protein H1164_16280 [Thermoactinomyces daqus]|uniref:Uncharacterized protein n=1 Tax=Thermoactinomyces daqus TaxID=1329516 RepID=A0A7W1XD68_9BACL|nr:hypothetical protein [Thermoactinomyces daqus]
MKFYGKTPRNHLLTTELMELVRKYPDLFMALANIFDKYKKQSEAVNWRQIERYIRSPRLSLPEIVCNQAKELMQKVYDASEDEFIDIRSQFLEEVIDYFGPFTPKFISKAKYREPLIMDQDEVVGKTDARCDVVFYHEDKVTLEMIECKANLKTFVTKSLDLLDPKFNRGNKKKIDYLCEVHRYLCENYAEPFVYIAFYNKNLEVTQERENVKRWGKDFLRFLDSVSIYNIVVKRSSINL